MKKFTIILSFLCLTLNANDFTKVPTHHGFDIYILPEDKCVSKTIADTGTWQPEIIETLSFLIKPGDKVLHLGGNIGFDDVFIAKLMDQKGELIVFEPNPRSYECLKQNLKLNNIENFVKAFPVGSWSEEKQLAMHFIESNVGACAVFSDHHWLRPNYFMAQLVKLDDFLPNLENLDVLFMDIEGAELHSLKGMENILKKSPNCKILMEWSPSMITSLGSDIDFFINQMNSLGMSFFKIQKSTHNKTEYSPIDPKGLLLLPDCDLLLLNIN